jgi:hypothetical protein
LRYIRFFVYYFFLTSIVILGYFYAEDNFRKPFSDFSGLDITRAIILAVIMWSYFGLTTDIFNRFEEISKKFKVLLAVVSFLVSLFTVGFLLSIYFEV